jgi:hypothetical protein
LLEHAFGAGVSDQPVVDDGDFHDLTAAL